MVMLKAATATAVVLSLALMPACSTPQTGMRTTQCNAGALGNGVVAANGILDPQIAGAFSPIPLDQVQILDPALAKVLMIQSAMKAPTATQTMRVQTRVVNCRDEAIQLDARTHFVSPSGASNEPVSAWNASTFPPARPRVYEETSIGTVMAEKFLIEIREGE